MGREQGFPNTHQLSISGNPLAALFRTADAIFARAYATLGNSRVARRFAAPLAGIIFAFLVAAKALHTVQLITEGPALTTASATLSFWSTVLYQLLGLVFTLLIVILIGVRKPAQHFVKSFGGSVIALAGTFASFALVLDGHDPINGTLAPLASLFLIGGMTFSIWSLATLGRCFSIMPEVRGLVTSGPYSRIRHPLYLGEIVATFGVLLPILSARNVAVFAAVCLLQLWRTRYEEATLSATFPEYADYRRRTARIIPGLF